MTYTAWDYRKLAEYHEQLGNAIIAKHYLAHADALEENARLRAELAKLRQHAEAMAIAIDKADYRPSLIRPLEAYRADFPGEK